MQVNKTLLNGVIPDRQRGEGLCLAAWVRGTGRNPTRWNVNLLISRNISGCIIPSGYCVAVLPVPGALPSATSPAQHLLPTCTSMVYCSKMRSCRKMSSLIFRSWNSSSICTWASSSCCSTDSMWLMELLWGVLLLDTAESLWQSRGEKGGALTCSQWQRSRGPSSSEWGGRESTVSLALSAQ